MIMHIDIERQRGHALFLAIVAGILVLGVISMSLQMVSSASREHLASQENLMCLYVAEGGVQQALIDLQAEGEGNLGAEGAPVSLGSGEIWVTTADQGDGTMIVTSVGTYNTQSITVRALVRPVDNVFDHAVFAGNSGGDPTYELSFGGSGDEADDINGAIYSGGDILIEDDASVVGDLRASGAITGGSGEEGVTQPIPEIAAMGYESSADVDVKAEFDASSSWESDEAGGTAEQVGSTNPAHIFRRNPSDRSTEIDGTEKDDYFLEDPYESVGVDSNQDGIGAYTISVDVPSDASGEILRKVYYIDGNLWIHNKRTYSFVFDAPDGVQVLIAVKGNIYISDNLFYGHANDAVALVAMKDDAVDDSGNIYFGDPRFGTLMTMNSFMYAENDFYDINLSASGSAEVTLNGTMSAGNKVDIQRDFEGHHSKLTVNYDDRIENGEVEIPGLPRRQRMLTYVVEGWMTMGGDQ